MTIGNNIHVLPISGAPRLHIVQAEDEDYVDPTETTGNRIRAYLGSLQMRDGATADREAYQRGLEAIYRLALGADGHEAPEYRLSLAEAAAILRFMTDSEPISHVDWWLDPEDAPSRICGYQFVMGAIARAIPGQS